MGCGASKAGPCAPVQVSCTGKSRVRLNSTSTKSNKTTKPLPKTTKAAELRRLANEAKLKNSNGLNSSASLRHSASKTQASKKITSSPRSPRPKDNQPNNATTASTSKPQNRHLAPNVPQSSSKPEGKSSKSTNEARPASSQSVKSLKSSGISKPSKENTVNTTSKTKTITEVRPASSQSVKSLKSSGISKPSKENTVNTTSKTKTITEVRPASSQSVKSLKSGGISKSSQDNAVNTANEARQQIYQSTKRPHSSPSLKKGSSDTKDGAKPMTSEPSKRPTSSPTKGQKQQLTKSCQPELPCSSSSVEENLPVIRSNVKATQRCTQGTVRPKSSQSNHKNTSKTNQTRFQPKSRPRSSPAFKGNPTEATNEVIKRPISNRLSKGDMPKTTSNVKRKSCPSLKSPVSRPASAKGNPARTVETRVTGQQAPKEAKADPTDQVLEDGDTPKREVVGDDFQSTSQESAASEAELDYFVAEILQSQFNLVQNEPSPEKSPKALNSQPSTMSSATAAPAPKQSASFVGTPKDATIEDNGSGCQEGTNSSTEVSNVGEAEITDGDSKLIQSPSTPTGIEDNEKAEETGSTSLTTGDVLTIFPKENPHIDSVELMGVPKPVQGGPSPTDSNTPLNFDWADERKNPGCMRSPPGATKSQEKINLVVERKSSKTSIDGRKSSRTPTASKSSAKISNLTAGDPVDGSFPSQTTQCSNSRPCSSRSTTDTSMSLNHRKSGQRPLSAAKVPEKSKSSENNPHSSARSFSDPRVSDATKSLAPSRKSSHGQVPVKSAERSLSSSRARSAAKKERLTPTSLRGEFKDEKGCKMSGSQEMSGRGSSATLSKRSVSRNSSKSAGTTSPTPSVVKKELEKSKSNDKIHQTPNEQKGVVKAKSSCYEREENAKSNDKGTIDGRHSQNSPSTSSLPIKEDLEKRPKSGRSISMGSNASIVKSEERLNNPRNSLSQNSLTGRVLSPPQKRHERSGSARSLKQSPRKFEVLESSKTLQFSSPSYPEVQSRNSRSKTSLNKMEVLNTDNVQNC